MPREDVCMYTIVVYYYIQLYYCLLDPNVLCSALQVAAKRLTLYVQCCKKLHSNAVMHSTIVLSVLKVSPTQRAWVVNKGTE